MWSPLGFQMVIVRTVDSDVMAATVRENEVPPMSSNSARTRFDGHLLLVCPAAPRSGEAYVHCFDWFREVEETPCGHTTLPLGQIGRTVVYVPVSVELKDKEQRLSVRRAATDKKTG